MRSTTWVLALSASSKLKNPLSYFCYFYIFLSFPKVLRVDFIISRARQKNETHIYAQHFSKSSLSKSGPKGKCATSIEHRGYFTCINIPRLLLPSALYLYLCLCSFTDQLDSLLVQQGHAQNLLTTASTTCHLSG